jgi:hypothetical protein
MIFTIPCKFDPARPVVFDCVRSIREFYPDVKVVVVDSASDDKSYLAKLRDEFGCVTLDVDNRHYAVNGYFLAYQEFPDEDFYACIHDSLMIRGNLDGLLEHPFTAVRHFDQPPNLWGWDADGVCLSEWGARELRRIGIGCPGQFTGIMGPMWFCQPHVMRELEQAGFFTILPEDKFELCGFERVAGIVFKSLGYEPSRSIQGPMFDFFAPYPSTLVEKVFLARP